MSVAVRQQQDHRSGCHGPPLQSEQLELQFCQPQKVSLQLRPGPDCELEAKARQMLHSLGATPLSENVRVDWNTRLRSAAGRADSRHARVSLNPRLREHGPAEIDRTLRHELAHLLAQSRAGRRRIRPHGTEWRTACRDLGIADEARCHTLPFPVREQRRPFLYRCSNCGCDFPRERQIRRVIACLACCRRYNRGRFDRRFQLRLVWSEMAR